jgi:hypothetical protein
MRSTKTVPLVLERELYERIQRDALEQERDPIQQCRYLIKQALAQSAALTADQREPAGAA